MFLHDLRDDVRHALLLEDAAGAAIGQQRQRGLYRQAVAGQAAIGAQLPHGGHHAVDVALAVVVPDGDAGALAEQRFELDRRGLAQTGDISGEGLAQRPGQLQTQRKQEIAARSVLAGELEFEDATVLTDRNALHQVHLDCAP
ncbi:hypothetical protein ACU11_11125 [Xanthomonas oryzae pv. oryzicola]|nr:hypothetical protein ACU11_11125 [Xanthomonas oryzae pv. oryzicola]